MTGGIDDVRVTGDLETGADIRDLAVIDQHVDALSFAVQPDPAKQHAHAAPSFPTDPVPTSTWNSTAIRTCTPLETCCSTADCGESATEDAISMPRTIGPGCSTTAWSGSIAWRRSESP